MAARIKPGDRFERWTILKKSCDWAKWHARCDCGTEKVVQSGHLLAGQTKSCGCLRDELISLRAKHGGHGTCEYSTWLGMRRRCHNPNDKNYPRYGGRGVTICERWSEFAAFFADMGRKPSVSHSIERRDNNAGYSPENCCWATAKQQTENRRTNQYVRLAEEIVTVAEAARRLGRHRSTIWNYSITHNVTRQQAVDHYASREAASK